jgi:hypothetical protein
MSNEQVPDLIKFQLEMCRTGKKLHIIESAKLNKEKFMVDKGRVPGS